MRKHFWSLPVALVYLLAGCAGSNLKLLPGGQLPALEAGVMTPENAFSNHGNPAADPDVRQLMETLHTLIAMTERKDFSALPGMISKKQGIFIDLKAHITYEELVREVTRPEGYFENFYFDTNKLRKHTKDNTQYSVRDLLLSTGRIRVDFFKDQNGNRCELKLHLLDHPELDYRLNNPVFLKEEGVWKVYALF